MKENELKNIIDTHPVLPGVIETISSARTGRISIEGLS